MRLTRVGICLLVAAAVTVLVTVIAPNVGMVMAIVLAVFGLIVLSEGFVGSQSTGAGAGHEAWTQVEADRKRDALRRGR